MDIDMTQVLLGLLNLIFALIMTFIVPPARKQLIENRWTDQAKIAIQAAEMLYGAGRGDEKKQYVYDYLVSKGLKFNPQEIDALIESGVMDLKKEILEVNEEWLQPVNEELFVMNGMPDKCTDGRTGEVL